MIIQIHQKQMSAPRVQICSRFLPTVEFFLADLGEEDAIVLVDGVSGPPPHYYYFFDLMSAFIAFRVPLTSSTGTRKHSSCCISGTLFACSQITHFYSSHMTESGSAGFYSSFLRVKAGYNLNNLPVYAVSAGLHRKTK